MPVRSKIALFLLSMMLFQPAALFAADTIKKGYDKYGRPLSGTNSTFNAPAKATAPSAPQSVRLVESANTGPVDGTAPIVYEEATPEPRRSVTVEPVADNRPESVLPQNNQCPAGYSCWWDGLGLTKTCLRNDIEGQGIFNRESRLGGICGSTAPPQ